MSTVDGIALPRRTICGVARRRSLALAPLAALSTCARASSSRCLLLWTAPCRPCWPRRAWARAAGTSRPTRTTIGTRASRIFRSRSVTLTIHLRVKPGRVLLPRGASFDGRGGAELDRQVEVVERRRSCRPRPSSSVASPRWTRSAARRPRGRARAAAPSTRPRRPGPACSRSGWRRRRHRGGRVGRRAGVLVRAPWSGRRAPRRPPTGASCRSGMTRAELAHEALPVEARGGDAGDGLACASPRSGRSRCSSSAAPACASSWSASALAALASLWRSRHGVAGHHVDDDHHEQRARARRARS